MDEPQKRKKFNWELLVGCVVIAIALAGAGNHVATNITQNMHGRWCNCTGHTVVHSPSQESGEFLTEWEAAMFLSIDHRKFDTLVQAGELSGTYATFQVERQVWQTVDIHDMRYIRRHEDGVFSWSEAVPSGDFAITAVPIPVQEVQGNYEIIIEDHRIFSREKLANWLNSRIENGQ
jgi:hypothetical protein